MRFKTLEESCINNNMMLNSEDNNRNKIRKGFGNVNKCNRQNMKPERESVNKLKSRKECNRNLEFKCCRSSHNRINWNKWLNRKGDLKNLSIKEKFKDCGKRN